MQSSFLRPATRGAVALGYPLQVRPRATQHTSGFPLLSLADASTKFIFI
ncbi:MAG: hypothetical protein ACKVOQ_22945 [Cyclobacteriaceae bacterium]